MKVKCRKCGDIVENKSRRKFWCNCGKVMIDGENDRIKVAGGPSDILFVDEKNNEFSKAVQDVIKNSRFGKNGSYVPFVIYQDPVKIKLSETEEPALDYLDELYKKNEKYKKMAEFYDNEILNDIEDLLLTKYGIMLNRELFKKILKDYVMKKEKGDIYENN